MTIPRSDPTAIDLSGRVALVTGASAGLGKRFAAVLTAAGATVFASGRRLELLEKLAEELSALKGTCHPVQFDVTDAESIEPTLDVIQDAHGFPDILINNAGIPDGQRAHRMSTELVDSVLATNLRGPFLLSCAVARRLITAEQRGHIINLSSMFAYHYEGQGAALYSITKAGISRMTEVLAVEWARHRINVNAICPGFFMSEMMEGMIERTGDLSESFPRKRLGQPSQLDSTLLYLLSPASELVTGTVIKVDDCQFAR